MSPSSGTSTTSFSWTVTYTDLNNDAPTVKKVVIDGTGHDMTSADTTYCDRAIHTYSQMLAEGSHTYYFEFQDATNTVFFPVGPQATGPTVTAPAPAPPPPGAPPGAPPAPPPGETSPTATEPGFEVYVFLAAAAIAIGALRRRTPKN